nr:PTS sugar transporter subunit IIC [Desulfovermiculus halophilus]
MTQFRTALNTGFLDRPLTIGIIAAAVSGQWPQCLGAAVFFELVWLDLFPAGTFIPPQRIFSTALVCSVIIVLDLNTTAEVVIPLLCALPAAGLGMHIEKRLRMGQSESHTRLETWAARAEPRDFPTSMIWAGLAHKAAWESGVFLGAALLVTGFTSGVLILHPSLVSGWPLSWPHLWSLALIGAVLSVRIRRAYELLVAGICVCTLLIGVLL